MKIKNLSSYEFKQYNVVGVKAQINFAKTDNLEINLHEELSNPITEQNINLVEEFEPLLFAVDMETTELVNSKELNIDCLTLLDGHHRYDFIIRNIIELPIEVVLKQKKTDFLVGASVHSLEESEVALASGCDFLVFGPVWDTPSKVKFMPARGLDELSEVVALGAPVVGIGGIENPSQIKELHKLKVKGAAVLRACEETEKFNSLVEAWLTG